MKLTLVAIAINENILLCPSLLTLVHCYICESLRKQT